MSDSSSVSSASSTETTLSELLKDFRKVAKKQQELTKRIASMTKGMKPRAKKAATGEKKAPRKSSDGQRRWRHFQKFVWAQLKEENAAAPFKDAMAEAGTRWDKGNPITEEDQAAFEAWCEENPVPTAEEAAAAKEEKDAEAAAKKQAAKEKREAAKAEKAAATKEKKASTKATPSAAAKAAVAAAAPKPSAKKAAAGAGGAAAGAGGGKALVPAASPAPKAAPKSKMLEDGEHVIEGKQCSVISGHVWEEATGSALGVINPTTGKLDKTAKAIKACDDFMAAQTALEDKKEESAAEEADE